MWRIPFLNKVSKASTFTERLMKPDVMTAAAALGNEVELALPRHPVTPADRSKSDRIRRMLVERAEQLEKAGVLAALPAAETRAR